jgi:dynein light intermediate chain 1
VKTITTTSEPEQSFLTRQLDLLQKDTTKDPRQSFRILPSSTSTNTTNATTGGVVGPMGNTGLGLNLPGVEKAMLEMEGNGLTGEELKEKFARLGRRVCYLFWK